MQTKPVSQIDSIKEIELEMEQLKSQSPSVKNSLVWIIPLFLLSFILPFFPNRTGARPLIESIGYFPGVIFCLVIFIAVSYYSVYLEKQKIEKRLSDLYLRKRLLEKRANQGAKFD